VGRGQSLLKLASQSGLTSRGRAIEENQCHVLFPHSA
jgi:hypothetical protein